MLEKLVAEMCDNSDRTSSMSETSITSLNHIEQKHKIKDANEEKKVETMKINEVHK